MNNGVNTYIEERQCREKWAAVKMDAELPMKIFKKTNHNIPEQGRYSQALDIDYWSYWTKRTYEELTPARRSSGI